MELIVRNFHGVRENAESDVLVKSAHITAHREGFFRRKDEMDKAKQKRQATTNIQR